MIRFLTSLLLGITFIAVAMWGISNTHAKSHQTFLQDLQNMLPPHAYQGEACSVDVKSEKKLGKRTYTVGVTFANGEGAESFEINDGALGPQVVQFSHDTKKENFLKIVVEPVAGIEGDQQKLTVIRSRGQVAAVAIKEKVCFLN